MLVRCECGDDPVWRIHLEPSEGVEDVALDPVGLRALAKIVGRAQAARHCRVIVLEGGADVFCRGMDLNYLLEHADEDLHARMLCYADCIHDLFTCSKATVCVVEGAAYGGGLGIAAACDIVFATAKARFSLPECVLGLIPAMVLPILERRIGAAKARWLALTGHVSTAAEAEVLGLVDMCVEDGTELRSRLRRLLKQLLRTNPAAVANLKRFTEDVRGLPLSEALGRGAQQTADDAANPATLAGIGALVAGDAPQWFERYKPGEQS